MSEFDKQFEDLVNAIISRLSGDIRTSLDDIKDSVYKSAKELGEYVDKARALDDVLAIIKLDQVSADIKEDELYRKIRQVLVGKGLI